MKRVLVITYYWPPSGGSGVQRWVKFAKYLPSQGWQPVIYTPENPELIATDSSLLEDIPSEAEILKTKIFEPYGIYRSLVGRKDAAKGGSDEVNPVNTRKKTPMQKLSMFARGNFFIPDPRCLWIRPSVKFLKKYLKEHPVDLIVSTGPPHSMHLIAEKVAAATGIKWIADFRDPWTGMFYFKHLALSSWAERRHRKLEQRVLNHADAIVAVSPLVQTDFRAMTSTPVHLITNGYDEDDFRKQILKQVQDDAESKDDAEGKFNISHTGLFAADGNPLTLWEVLAEKCLKDKDFAKHLRIRLTGKNDSSIIASIREAGLSDQLVDNGYQPHAVAVREQQNASLLIIPLRREAEYRATLPGKLFECLASGRPILGIGQKDGAMATILADTGAGVVCDWDEKKEIDAYVDDAWEKFKAGTLHNDSRGVEQFSRKALTLKMAALMDSLTGSSGKRP